MYSGGPPFHETEYHTSFHFVSTNWSQLSLGAREIRNLLQTRSCLRHISARTTWDWDGVGTVGSLISKGAYDDNTDEGRTVGGVVASWFS